MKLTPWVLAPSCLLAIAASAAAQAQTPQGSCELTVEGAVTASGKSKGGALEVGTDYWFKQSEWEVRFRNQARGKTGPEVDAMVAEKMKKDPRFAALIFNCITDAATINFSPEGKYADVPFKAKKYVVKSAMPKNGEVSAMIKVGNDFYPLAEPGTLDVTAFDSRRFAGSFVLKAKKDASAITIKGKFDYPCVAPTQFCAESLNAK